MTASTKQGNQRSWIVPRATDSINCRLWLLAPWLAGIEWIALLLGIACQPTCGGVAYIDTIWIALIATILLNVGWRGFVWGAYPRLGSLVLAITNGFLLLICVASTISQWLEYQELMR